MHDLPLAALRAFALAVEHGGVRAAARELRVAHSSISRHIAQLEKRLGARLVEPAAGRAAFVVTAQGRALAKATLDGLRGIAAVVDAIGENRDGRGVTIATTPSLGARWLLPRLASLQAGGAEISVLLGQALSDLAAAGVDIAVRMGRGPWPDLDCTPLMGDTLFPVMSADYHERHGRPRTPRDLKRLALLHDRDPQAAWSAWTAVHGPSGLDTRKGARFASSDLVLQAAAEGLGVALARGRLAAADLAAGRLVRPFGERVVVLPDAYWLVLPRRLARRHAVTDVVERLKAAAG
jgi:LysR family glycine cleavage system transcriptional activator